MRFFHLQSYSNFLEQQSDAHQNLNDLWYVEQKNKG
jgi:hypothetical protein